MLMCGSGPSSENGQRIEGESNIGHAPAPSCGSAAVPERPPALPRALEAIASADLILLGPGSLYTSLLPNLLVPELVSAIGRSRAPRLYICNLMTQPGETDGLDVRGHLRAIEAQLASLGIDQRLFSAVLAQDDLEESDLVEHYRSAERSPWCVMPKGCAGMVTTSPKHPCRGQADGHTRHDSSSLALAVMRFYRSHRRDTDQ